MKRFFGLFLAVALLLCCLLTACIADEQLPREEEDDSDAHEEELSEAEKKELRDGAEVRYFAEEDLPELKDGEVDYGLTALYYTKEDGMWLHFAVCNGTDSGIIVEKISVILNNSKKQEEIANGASSFGEVKVEDRMIPAGETKEFEIYFPPKFVKIKDDTLKEVAPTLTLEYRDETLK